MDIKALKAGVMARMDVAAEFGALFEGWKPWENVACPMAAERHEEGTDNSKSCQLNEGGLVYCHACGYKAMTPIDLYADLKGVPFTEALEKFRAELSGPFVDGGLVASAHAVLRRSRDILAKLMERRGLAVGTVAAFKLGWHPGQRRLWIPVADEAGEFVNVRRYDLLKVHDSKMISYAKGYGSARLFWTDRTSKRVVLCEGELDALLLHQAGFPAVTSTGGANSWRKEWAAEFAGKDVFVLPDMDAPGKAAAARWAKELRGKAKSVRVVELPFSGAGKDFTDWMLSGGGSAEGLDTLLKAAETAAPQQAGAEDGATLLSGTYTQAERVNILRADMVLREVSRAGSFFRNGDGQLFLALASGTAMQMSLKSPRFLSYMADVDPLVTPATRSGQIILQHTMNAAEKMSASSRSGGFSLTTGGHLYVAADKGRILRYAPGVARPTVMKNAVNADSVLLETQYPVKFSEDSGADIGAAVNRYFSLVLSNMALKEEDRYFVGCWLLGMFFLGAFRARPLLRLTAKTGAGKTSASRLISNFVYGEEVLTHSASTLAATYAMAPGHPVMIFDNIETRNMVPALEDFMLVASTGGSKHKRQMSTDHGVVREAINSLVVTNGIEPFNKREIIDRTVELQLDTERFGVPHYHEANALSAILKERHSVMLGLLGAVAVHVLPRIGNGEVERISKEFSQHAKHRFNDYLALMSLVLDAIWEYRPFEKYARPHDVVSYWLDTQSTAEEQQDAGTNEVLHFMNTFVERRDSLPEFKARVREADGKIEVKTTTATLLSDFRLLAKHLGMRCPWTNDRQLGVRLHDSNDVLEKDGWTRRHAITAGKRMHIFERQIQKEEGNDGAKRPGITEQDARLAEEKLRARKSQRRDAGARRGGGNGRAGQGAGKRQAKHSRVRA